VLLCEVFCNLLCLGVGVKLDSVLLLSQCDVHFHEIWPLRLSWLSWLRSTSGIWFFRFSSLFLLSRGNRFLNERLSCLFHSFLLRVFKHLFSSSRVPKNSWLECVLVFLFSNFDLILISISNLGHMVLLGLLVKLFPFV